MFFSLIILVPSRSPYVQYTILGVDSIHLSISPIPEQHHNGKLLGYIILYRASCYLLNSSGQVNVSVSTTSYTLKGLLPGTKYEIRVAAFTSKGTGQYHYINVFTSKCSSRYVCFNNYPAQSHGILPDT